MICSLETCLSQGACSCGSGGSFHWRLCLTTSMPCWRLQLRVGCASPQLGLGCCASDSRRGFRNIRFCRVSLGLRALWSIAVSVGRSPDEANHLDVAMHTCLSSTLFFSALQTNDVREVVAGRVLPRTTYAFLGVSAQSLCLGAVGLRTPLHLFPSVICEHFCCF